MLGQEEVLEAALELPGDVPVELPHEDYGILPTMDTSRCGDVGGSTPLPHASSTILLVEDSEAQHLQKKRKLELTLLEEQIQSEKTRREAFAAMKTYYTELRENKKHGK